jgi:hypothetical protein
LLPVPGQAADAGDDEAGLGHEVGAQHVEGLHEQVDPLVGQQLADVEQGRPCTEHSLELR